MQAIALLIAVMAISVHLNSAESYKTTECDPILKVLSFSSSSEASGGYDFSITFSSSGKATVALSPEQFEISLSDSKGREVYLAPIVFSKDVPSVFVAQADNKVSLNAKSLKNTLNTNGIPNSIPPGKYSTRIKLHSSKQREFDYQWLGMMQSDTLTVTLR